jgi:guanine deaminase
VAPPPETVLDVGLRHAAGPEDALAKTFALATPYDVAQVWIAGAPVKPEPRDLPRGSAIDHRLD